MPMPVTQNEKKLTLTSKTFWNKLNKMAFKWVSAASISINFLIKKLFFSWCSRAQEQISHQLVLNKNLRINFAEYRGGRGGKSGWCIYPPIIVTHYIYRYRTTIYWTFQHFRKKEKKTPILYSEYFHEFFVVLNFKTLLVN